MSLMTRRVFLAALPLSVAACTTSGPGSLPLLTRYAAPPEDYRQVYAAMNDGGVQVPAVDLNWIKPAFRRREVFFPTDEAPGTVIVDTPNRYLYLVEDGGKAMRYGIGVGREGFAWSGRAEIARKSKWPSWHPPVEMQARDDGARKWAGGMPGGIKNPLGARAHYLYQNGHDTLYRIHGTTEPWTIGSDVSSGCIRMVNQDVIDLFQRVKVGATVVVL